MRGCLFNRGLPLAHARGGRGTCHVTRLRARRARRGRNSSCAIPAAQKEREEEERMRRERQEKARLETQRLLEQQEAAVEARRREMEVRGSRKEAWAACSLRRPVRPASARAFGLGIVTCGASLAGPRPRAGGEGAPEAPGARAAERGEAHACGGAPQEDAAAERGEAASEAGGVPQEGEGGGGSSRRRGESRGTSAAPRVAVQPWGGLCHF